MKKEQFSALKSIAPKDLPSIATSADPLNGGRLPVGKKFIVLPNMVEVPASGNVTKPWAAIAVQVGDEYYTLSPRTFLGLGFQDKKLVQVIDTKVPKGALVDTLKKNLSGKVTEYKEVDIDVFGKDEKAPKGFPIFDFKVTD